MNDITLQMNTPFSYSKIASGGNVREILKWTINKYGNISLVDEIPNNCKTEEFVQWEFGEVRIGETGLCRAWGRDLYKENVFFPVGPPRKCSNAAQMDLLAATIENL